MHQGLIGPIGEKGVKGYNGKKIWNPYLWENRNHILINKFKGDTGLSGVDGLKGHNGNIGDYGSNEFYSTTLILI